MKVTRLWFVVSIALLVAASSLFGQGGGTVEGTISDPSGAVIPGASITARNVDTGVETKRVSNSAGLYVLALSPGRYNIEATAAGFQRVTQENVVVAALGVRGLNLQLTVGAATESVTISATAQTLQTESVSLGHSVPNEVYTQLPLSMGGGVPRDATQFIALAPGVSSVVTQSAGSSFTSFNGAQQDTNGLYLEGVSMTYPNWQGDTRLIALGISVEAIDQFQVQVNGQKAQYQGQGFHNYQLKSGTNKLHGAIYEYLRNTAMDARGFFSPFLYDVQDKQNEFGGNVGGPILKDKLFYFANYSGYFFKTSSAPNYQTIPTMPFRTGDFSAALPVQVIYDPDTLACPTAICTKSPFVNNIIPANRLSSVSKSLQSYLPATSNSAITNNYLSSLPRAIHNNNGTAKIDWNTSSTDRFYANIVRGTWETDYSGNIGFDATMMPLPYNSSPGVVVEVTSILQLHYTKMISPAIINNFSGAATRLWIPIYCNTCDGNFPQKAGLTGLPSYGKAATGFPSVTFTGNNAPRGWGGNPFDEAQNNFTFQDNVSWIRGKHVLGFGFNYQIVQDARPDINTGGTTASFTFNATSTQGFNAAGNLIATTGHPYASYMLGAVNNATINQRNLVGVGHRFGNYSFHGQDDWKVSSRLTLNLGLRWDLYKPYREQYGRYSFLNPDAPNPALGGYKGQLNYGGFGANSCNCVTPMKTHKRNFQPRLGLAYSLNDKTVLRMGFGLSYTLGTTGIGGRGATGPGVTGFDVAGSISSIVTGAPLFNWDQGVPPRPVFALRTPEFGQGNTNEVPTGAVNVTYVDPELSGKAPYYLNWSFGLQRQFTPSLMIGADYSASTGHFLVGGASPALWTNSMPKKYLALGALLGVQATPANLAAAQAMFPEIRLPFSNYRGAISQMLRPFAQYGGVSCFSCNLGNSSYHSLQVTVTRSFAQGFYTQFSYTLSKILDNVPSGGQLGSAGGNRDPYNAALDRGMGQTDRRHILRGSYVYYLPVGKGHAFSGGHRVVRAIISDWMVSGTFMMNTGRPLGVSGTCVIAGLTSSCIPSYNRAFTGSVKTAEYGEGNVIAPGAAVYLNRNAFVNPAAYEFGDLPRSAPYGLRAPFYFDLAATIKREFPFRETMKFTLGADVFNVPNTVIFDAPNTSIDNVNFGQLTAVQNAPRKIQLNARISW